MRMKLNLERVRTALADFLDREDISQRRFQERYLKNTVSQSQFNKILNGQHKMGLDLFLTLCQVLEVHLDHFIDHIPQPIDHQITIENISFYTDRSNHKISLTIHGTLPGGQIVQR